MTHCILHKTREIYISGSFTEKFCEHQEFFRGIYWYNDVSNGRLRCTTWNRTATIKIQTTSELEQDCPKNLLSPSKRSFHSIGLMQGSEPHQWFSSEAKSTGQLITVTCWCFLVKKKRLQTEDAGITIRAGKPEYNYFLLLICSHLLHCFVIYRHSKCAGLISSAYLVEVPWVFPLSVRMTGIPGHYHSWYRLLGFPCCSPGEATAPFHLRLL